jgi:hypothetical protein
MSARNEQRREEWMSTDTIVHYMINAALFGLATGAAAAIVAIFVAGK